VYSLFFRYGSIGIGFCCQGFQLKGQVLGQERNSIGIYRKNNLWIDGTSTNFENLAIAHFIYTLFLFNSFIFAQRIVNNLFLPFLFYDIFILIKEILSFYPLSLLFFPSGHWPQRTKGIKAISFLSILRQLSGGFRLLTKYIFIFILFQQHISYRQRKFKIGQ